MTVKLQTKLISAFFGSIVLAIMLWDRGTELGYDDNPLNYREEGDERVIPRGKRNVPVSRLNEAYNLLIAADACCPNMPKIIPDDAQVQCDSVLGGAAIGKKQRKKNTRNKAGNLNFFQRLGKRLLGSNTNANTNSNNNKNKNNKNNKNNKINKNNKNKVARQGRQTAKQQQKILLSSVCYSACIFTYMGWLNDSALELDAIERDFLDTASQPTWDTKIQDGLYTCEEPSACATPEVITVTQGYCSIKPTILLNCIRKQLVLSCPDPVKSTTCNKKLAQLRRQDMTGTFKN